MPSRSRNRRGALDQGSSGTPAGQPGRQRCCSHHGQPAIWGHAGTECGARRRPLRSQSPKRGVSRAASRSPTATTVRPAPPRPARAGRQHGGEHALERAPGQIGQPRRRGSRRAELEHQRTQARPGRPACYAGSRRTRHAGALGAEGRVGSAASRGRRRRRSTASLTVAVPDDETAERPPAAAPLDWRHANSARLARRLVERRGRCLTQPRNPVAHRQRGRSGARHLGMLRIPSPCAPIPSQPGSSTTRCPGAARRQASDASASQPR